MEKEKLEGRDLLDNAILVRLDALKKALSKDQQEVYRCMMEHHKLMVKERFHINESELDLWFQ